VEELRNLVEVMAKALVDFSRSGECRGSGRRTNHGIELKVAKRRLGKIIGKEGRTARSLRYHPGCVSTNSVRLCSRNSGVVDAGAVPLRWNGTDSIGKIAARTVQG